MSLMMLTLILLAVCIVPLVALIIYRIVLGRGESGEISIHPMADSAERERLERARSIEKVSSAATSLAVISGILVLLVVGLWIRRGFYGPIILF